MTQPHARDHADDAASALAHADRLAADVNRRAKWYVAYLVTYGVASFVLTLVLGMVAGPVAATIAITCWGVVIGGLSAFAARQPVARRGFGRRHGLVVGAWALLYGVVLLPGLAWFPGEPLWWVPGAILVSLPAFAGAILEARR